MMENIYIHEDFYNLITILPHNKNLNIPENKIVEFSDFNLFKDSNIEFINLKINDLREKIKKYNSTEFDRIYIGYSTTFEAKKNTIAYVFNEIGVFIETTNLGIIKNIWLYTIPYPSNVPYINLFSFLLYLGTTYNLILVDYQSNYLSDLSKMQSIKEYFKEVFWIQ